MPCYLCWSTTIVVAIVFDLHKRHGQRQGTISTGALDISCFVTPLLLYDELTGAEEREIEAVVGLGRMVTLSADYPKYFYQTLLSELLLYQT